MAGLKHIALLRGINVGGKNKLAMKDLAALFEAAGCDDVATFIQSGNVVFRASSALARKVPALLERAIEKHAGFRAPVLVRSADEMRAVLAGNPFVAAHVDGDQLHVVFLRDASDGAHESALDPKRSPPDEFVVRGREIYLRLPNGVARSKLTAAYFDAKLATTTTQRNWRTVQSLVDLAARALSSTDK